jgi:hypothetical protein
MLLLVLRGNTFLLKGPRFFKNFGAQAEPGVFMASANGEQSIKKLRGSVARS